MEFLGNKKCGRITEHEGHFWDETVLLFCSGTTKCGTFFHDPHEFPDLVEFWCEGLCLCGLPGYGAHGPGEHK